MGALVLPTLSNVGLQTGKRMYFRIGLKYQGYCLTLAGGLLDENENSKNKQKL